MYKQARCTCKVIVLLIKPIVIFTFSLPSVSLDLKFPDYLGMTRTVVSQRTIDAELRTGDLIANQIREGCLTQNPTRELRMTKEGSATTIM